MLEDVNAQTAFLITNSFYPNGTEYQVDAIPFPVCFVKGSLITSLRGPIAIEDLVEGDAVQGSSGWRAVKWVGWRNYGAASFLTQESKSRIAPVQDSQQFFISLFFEVVDEFTS